MAIVRRTAFTPMPRVQDYVELQQHVDACCMEYLETHRIRYRPASIKTLLAQERQQLNPLPLTPLETAKTVTALVNPDLTVIWDQTRYSVPQEYVGEKVTLKISPFTIAVWYRGQEIYTHMKALHKGDHQYIPEHYLELLTRKPRAVMNAAPLKKGVMPQELKDFLCQCKAKDKQQQLLQILLLSRGIEDCSQLLWAVHQANQSGNPTYQLVCFYLKLSTPAAEGENQDGIVVEHADLTEYDRLMDGEGNDD